jgi:hypothetical protein
MTLNVVGAIVVTADFSARFSLSGLYIDNILGVWVVPNTSESVTTQDTWTV